MAKADSPREACRERLDYDRLVSTLDMIDGEPVIVRLTPREADKHLEMTAAGGDEPFIDAGGFVTAPDSTPASNCRNQSINLARRIDGRLRSR